VWYICIKSKSIYFESEQLNYLFINPAIIYSFILRFFTLVKLRRKRKVSKGSSFASLPCWGGLSVTQRLLFPPAGVCWSQSVGSKNRWSADGRRGRSGICFPSLPAMLLYSCNAWSMVATVPLLGFLNLTHIKDPFINPIF
jgi:hypothetical protein